MSTQRQPKPTIDAVNDAIGALSDLLYTLRAHAKAAAREVKSTSSVVGAKAKKVGRTAMKNGKKAVRKAESTGEGLLDKAAKVWNDITGSEDAHGGGTAVATRKPRVARKTRK